MMSVIFRSLSSSRCARTPVLKKILLWPMRNRLDSSSRAWIYKKVQVSFFFPYIVMNQSLGWDNLMQIYFFKMLRTVNFDNFVCQIVCDVCVKKKEAPFFHRLVFHPWNPLGLHWVSGSHTCRQKKTRTETRLETLFLVGETAAAESLLLVVTSAWTPGKRCGWGSPVDKCESPRGLRYISADPRPGEAPAFLPEETNQMNVNGWNKTIIQTGTLDVFWAIFLFLPSCV